MRSLSLVMSEYSLRGRGQGHVSNFYIVDLENFASASHRYTGDIHNSTVVGLFISPIRQWSATPTHHGWVHMFITHRPTLTLQPHNFDLFRTCHTSSFWTVAWQLARFQLTRRIAWSLGDSWTSCYISAESTVSCKKIVKPSYLYISVYLIVTCWYCVKITIAVKSGHLHRMKPKC